MADTAAKPKEEQVVEEDDEFEEFENDGNIRFPNWKIVPQKPLHMLMV